ncbi:sodium:solute symporter family protein [Paradesulfitobacterium ferrireducens]|uniref:sodium:solute symporter family protein n=1 Tax=Paradesulfitobacterium ferrireducens TaxID=2816476 RepID=UPI001A9006F6|nr:sodium:solute symporter family protein [Paradesulfitobacterium ferrireducens]
MNAYGYWMLGIAFLYTMILIGAGVVAKKRAKQSDGYFVGGRQFNRWTVSFMITGLFAGSTYISILELTYIKGISAAWYGVAELTHILIIALVLIGSFREKLLVTISGLIGDKFGRAALGIAGFITAVTFPMWSVATALAFASALHVLTGLSMMTSVIVTALLLLVYLQAGGMWSIAFTQTANLIAFFAMFVVAAIAIFINPGLDGIARLAATKPAMFDAGNVGLQVILAWFGTFWVNVLVAQAAFQMALSCKTPEEGRKGLYIAAGFNVVFIVMAVMVGLATAAVMPGISRGLMAVPTYLMQTLPPPLVGVFTLGIWAAALGWGAPCQFSGATSLGRDVGRAIFPQVTPETQVKWTKISLVILTGLMVGYGFLRSENAAWWNVFAWTARNGATFAPVLAALLWPVATRFGVVSAMILGFGGGLVWNALGNWSADKFYLNVHPVWVGMIFNILGLVLISLLGRVGQIKFSASVSDGKRKAGFISAGIAGVILLVIGLNFQWLFTKGLLGMFLFLVVLSAWVVLISFVSLVENGEVAEGKIRIAGVGK